MTITTAIKTVFANTSRQDDVKIPAWVCVQDAKKRDAENIKLYTAEEQRFAEGLLGTIGDVYGRSNTYMNYRKKFVAVKVDSPRVRDKVSLAAVRLDCWCETNGVEKVITRHGNFVYRVSHDVIGTLV